MTHNLQKIYNDLLAVAGEAASTARLRILEAAAHVLAATETVGSQ
jgi:hypothetical protein